MERVFIVIVTFNSARCIGACLDALAGFPGDLLVVDNASQDNTREIVSSRPRARLLANPENKGFGAAVNQGVNAAETPLILLLNPDTRAFHGLDKLTSRFTNPETGAAGGLLTNPDGSPQSGFMCRRLPTPAALAFEVLGLNRLFPRNPVNWSYRCLDLDPMAPSPVEQPAGAFLMFTRAAWSKVGGFSERYFPIWFEDVDFCARLRKAGFGIEYDPEARAIHDGAHSIGSLPVEKRERCWYGSLLEYAASHYGPFSFRAVCLAVASGAALRGVRGLPSNGFKSLAVYGAVCRLALSRFFRPRPNIR